MVMYSRTSKSALQRKAVRTPLFTCRALDIILISHCPNQSPLLGADREAHDDVDQS